MCQQTKQYIECLRQLIVLQTLKPSEKRGSGFCHNATTLFSPDTLRRPQMQTLTDSVFVSVDKQTYIEVVGPAQKR